ncbi:alpha/beta hydrolase [Porticoccaceae bacterium]|nr:alpha/beta hydrolase [Porticoccaceae bacterium]
MMKRIVRYEEKIKLGKSTTIIAASKLLTQMFLVVVVLLGSVFTYGNDAEDEKSKEMNYLMETYTYKIVDDLEIKADVYRYPGDDIRPVIMWIHGGALIMGSRAGLPPAEQFEAYLKAGYVLVSIDYRLAPETKLKAIVEDVEDAYAWIRADGPELFNINPDKIAVIGASAGGYLTLTSGFRLNSRPRALVSLYGYGDVTGPWYSQPYEFYRDTHPIVSKKAALSHVSGTPISNTNGLDIDEQKGRADFYLYCRQHGLWPDLVSGYDLSKEPEKFRDYEARVNITADYPPTMLLHGEKDTDVIFEQSVLMAKELKRNNVDHEFVTNPDWGHGFDYDEKDPTVQDAHKQILKFLEKHL